MHDAVVIGVKAIAGGSLVVFFALVGHAVRPKWFAGLFAAAPSIAMASLLVTVVDKGDHAAATASLGMAFGAVGFVVYAAAVRPLLDRLNAAAASSVAFFLWSGVAVGGYFLLNR